MSVEAMAWVLNHSDTTGTERLVLLGIANHADENGENAWPGVPTLARYAGVGERATRYALRSLEKAGHIVTESRKGGRVDSDPRYRTNRYRVVGVLESRGAQPCRSDQSRGARGGSQGGTTAHPGGHGVAGKPSLNHSEPSACPACGFEGSPHPNAPGMYECLNLDCNMAWRAVS